jgi:hypothetical protein
MEWAGKGVVALLGLGLNLPTRVLVWKALALDLVPNLHTTVPRKWAVVLGLDLKSPNSHI